MRIRNFNFLFIYALASSVSANVDIGNKKVVLDLNSNNFIYLGTIESTGSKIFYAPKTVLVDSNQPPNSGGLTVINVIELQNYAEKKITSGKTGEVESIGIFYNRNLIQQSINCPTKSYAVLQTAQLKDDVIVAEARNTGLTWFVANPSTPYGKIMMKMIDDICS